MNFKEMYSYFLGDQQLDVRPDDLYYSRRLTDKADYDFSKMAGILTDLTLGDLKRFEKRLLIALEEKKVFTRFLSKNI